MLFFGAVLCMRLQGEVLNRERQASVGAGGDEIVSNGFWSMGGYARFVWPCFAFALAGAGVEFVVRAPLSRGALEGARARSN